MKKHTKYLTLGLGLFLVVMILAGCQSAADSAIQPEAVVVAAGQTPTDNPPTTEPPEPTPMVKIKKQTEPNEAVVETGYQEGFTEEGSPFKGDPTASVVIEEFSSYQCPYCSKYFRETYPQIMANYVETGQVLYIYRDFPLQSQPQSPLAAQAAHCAGQVGDASAYWAMHDRLFENQHEWSGKGSAADIFSGYAANLGLDEAAFNQCLDSGATRAQVEIDAANGVSRNVRGTPTFYINGQALVGAQPYAAFEQALDAALSGKTPATAEPSAPAAAPTPAAIAPTGDDLSLGNPDAPVTIVEFSDYQCPYCERYFQQTWPQLKAEFIDTGQVRYVFKDFPLISIHPQAPKAHEATRCAGEQDAYWEMHDRIFGGQSEWANKASHVDIFKGYAAELGLDQTAFDACLDSDRWVEAVNTDFEEGVSHGVRGTPSFFVNGYPLVGAQPYEVFQQIIKLAEQGQLGEALQPSP